MSVNNENSTNTPESGANNAPKEAMNMNMANNSDIPRPDPVDVNTTNEIDYDTETWDVIKSYFDIRKLLNKAPH